MVLAVLVALPAGASAQTTTQQNSSPRSAQQAPTKATQPSAPAKSPAPDGAMTNRDVIALVKARLSDDVIISKIKQSKTQFDTSTQGLVTLKYAGVSDRIISVMVAPTDSGSAAPTAGSSGAAAGTRSNGAPTKDAPTATTNKPPLRPGRKPLTPRAKLRQPAPEVPVGPRLSLRHPQSPRRLRTTACTSKRAAN